MCKAYDPRLIVAWPSAKIAVMGGDQAAKTLLSIQVSTLKAKGEIIDPEKEKELLKTITDRYERQTTAFYAAARLWVDAIIDPMDTANGSPQASKRPTMHQLPESLMLESFKRN